MTARVRFTKLDVERALSGAVNAGVSVAVLIQPDGSIAIVPADKISVTVTANDIDDRLEKFGAR
jgi:hypothetical protein